MEGFLNRENLNAQFVGGALSMDFTSAHCESRLGRALGVAKVLDRSRDRRGKNPSFRGEEHLRAVVGVIDEPGLDEDAWHFGAEQDVKESLANAAIPGLGGVGDEMRLDGAGEAFAFREIGVKGEVAQDQGDIDLFGRIACADFGREDGVLEMSEAAGGFVRRVVQDVGFESAGVREIGRGSRIHMNRNERVGLDPVREPGPLPERDVGVVVASQGHRDPSGFELLRDRLREKEGRVLFHHRVIRGFVNGAMVVAPVAGVDHDPEGARGGVRAQAPENQGSGNQPCH